MPRLGRAAIASFTLACLATACAQPSVRQSGVDQAFAAHRRTIATVDILPVDLEVWSCDRRDDDAEVVRVRAEAAAGRVVGAMLARNGFRVASVIDWTGRARGAAPGDPPALAPRDLRATLGVLGAYGTTAIDGTDGLPTPHVPVRLGRASHADATLYIGGWSYLGKEIPSDGEQHLRGLGVGVGIAALLVLDPHPVLSGVLDVSDAAGRGPAADDVEPPSRRTGAATGRFALRTDDEADDFLVPRTVVPTRSRSVLALEMTLVDNRTGRALWHSHQQFPTDAASPRDVQRAVLSLMANLPARTAPAHRSVRSPATSE